MLAMLGMLYGRASNSFDTVAVWTFVVGAAATFLRIASEMTETRFKSEGEIGLARLEDRLRFIIQAQP